MAMIRPETEMKDSGIQWIGDIPNNWNIKPLYACLDEINQKNNPIVTTNILSLTNTDGVIPYSERGNQGNKSKENFEEYKVVYPNTIVANSMNILIGSVGLSKYEGCVSPVYYVYMAKPQVDIRYMNYLFQMEPFQKRLRQFANGILEIRLRVSSHDILHQKVAVPDYDEQQAIADYLDETCSKIDEIIAEAKASIDEYKELKQSVIFEAVTKGLDKNVEFIDSGDEWLGKYPQSYNIGQLSMLSNIVRGGSPRPAGDPRYYGGNISFMRIADITKDDNIYVNSCENTITEEGLTRTRMIPPNTLLLTNSGATLGVPKINTFETAFNDGIAAFLDLDERLNIVYVYFFLKARTSYFLECASMGMGQPNLNTDIIGRTKIVFPTLVEQQKVISYLEDRCGKLNSLISEKESLIKDLESYKKSLIYEVVTGKRRVV